MGANLYQQTRNILRIHKSTLIIILIYSLFISILTLSVPIAAQTLVNMVSFGTVVRPIIILTLILAVLLCFAVAIKLAQAVVVENIQQSIFAQMTLRFAEKLSQLKFTNFRDYRGPELVNRFFEVVTVQKTTGMICITVVEIVLQAVFSMIVLAFYHPFLLAYDIILVIMMALVILVPYRGALKTAIKESDHKYDVAAWLDDISESPLTFRLNHNHEYALETTDNKLLGYVRARQQHFRFILGHLVGIGIVYILGNTVLLGLGGYLVIQGQLSLGQLVAAELLVNIILTGFIKLGNYFEDYYDLLAGVLKLSRVLNLSTDPKKPEHTINAKLTEHLVNFESLQVKDLASTPGSTALSFELQKNQTLLIEDPRLALSRFFVDQLFKFSDQDYTGTILINKTDLGLYDGFAIREHFTVVRGFEIFSGSLLDNLCLDKNDIKADDLKSIVEDFGLSEAIHQLPYGYDTRISGHPFIFNVVFLQKISLIRALLAKPALLVLEGSLDVIPVSERSHILNTIKQYTPTLIVCSQEATLAQYFDHAIRIDHHAATTNL